MHFHIWREDIAKKESARYNVLKVEVFNLK